MAKLKPKRKAKAIFQQHHVRYEGSGNKEVVRRIRKGVHYAISILRRFKFLTSEEIDTVKLEAELKRKYERIEDES